jgi:hypothetical protein
MVAIAISVCDAFLDSGRRNAGSNTESTALQLDGCFVMTEGSSQANPADMQSATAYPHDILISSNV